MSASNPFRRSKIITTAPAADQSVLPSSSPSYAIASESAGIQVDSLVQEYLVNQSNINQLATPSTPQHQQQQQLPRVVSSSPAHPTISTPTPKPKPTPTTKTTTTSSYFPAVSFAGLRTHSGSPPPPPNSLPQQSVYDGYSSSDEAEVEHFDPRPSAAFDIAAQSPQSLQSRAPRAPRGQTRGQARQLTSSSGRDAVTNNDNNNTSSSSSTLDVDAFTRLLLTGSAEARQSATTTTPDAVPANTDASFSPVPVNPEKTTTSHKTDTDHHENENENETPEQTHVEEAAISRSSTMVSVAPESNDVKRMHSLRKPKPPPPRSHHGKPIKRPSESGRNTRDPSVESPTIARSPYDGGRRRGSASSLSAKPSSVSTESTDDVPSLQRTASTSKRPPTPPLSRRHSQMRPPTMTRQPAPAAASTAAVEKPARPPLASKTSSSLSQGPLNSNPEAKTPPRPPPTRRPERPLSGVHIDTNAAETKSSTQPSTNQSSTTHTIATATQIPTTASTSSPPSRASSVRNNIIAATTSTTTTLPPPPPPPRRLRASSKSSANAVATDGIDNTSSAALPTITAPAAPAAPAATTVPDSTDTTDSTDSTDSTEPPSMSHAHDILADLSRLQREVDDLRGHYEGRKVSQ